MAHISSRTYITPKKSKVEKFFGEMPRRPMASRDFDETPSFLSLDHEADISYDMKTSPPQLRGGILTAFVEQLTRHDRLDSPFNNTFLLTYKSFTTAPELYELLVKRFSIQSPRKIYPPKTTESGLSWWLISSLLCKTGFCGCGRRNYKVRHHMYCGST